MKRTHKLRSALSIALLLLLCFAAFGTIGAAADDDSAEVTWEVGAWEDAYVTGETVTIPAAILHVGDETITDVTTTVIRPDGTATLATSFVATEYGTYRVIRTATHAGRVWRDDRYFTVHAAVAASSGTKSTISWGEVPLLPSKTGLNVQLASGETLTFSETIRVDDLTRNDVFLEFFMAPATKGAYDCEQWYVVMTDADDPNNQVTIYGRASEEGASHNVTYILAKASGQAWSAWDYTKNFVRHSDWGTYVTVSMYGLFGGVYQPDYGTEFSTFKLGYDAETRNIYVNGRRVTDLDDPTFVDDTVWGGFKSDRVQVSVYCKSYTAERAGLVFTQLRGADLSATHIEDTEGPTITLGDSLGINAVAGGSYPLRDATAIDAFTGEVDVTASVTYTYPEFSLWEVDVPVEGGRFRTARAGTYTVRYSARDAFGNETTLTDTVVCQEIEAEEKMTAAFDGELPTTIKRGAAMVLPAVSTECALGTVTMQITATHGGTTDVVDGNTYAPLDAGTYVFTYTVTDAVGQTETLTFTATAEEDEQPVFRDEPQLPQYYISGFLYRAPTLFAYTYENGAEKTVAATLTVRDAEGSITIPANGSFMPVVKANGDKIELIWRAGETELRRTVTVLQLLGNAGPMLENLFIADGVDMTLTSDKMLVTAASEAGTWSFVNELVADNFTLKLEAETHSTAFDGVLLRLTDAEDESLSVSIRIMKNELRSRTYVSGNAYLTAPGFTRNSDYTTFSIRYYDGNVSIGGISMPVTTFDDGTAFTSFPSERVRVEVGFIGAEAGSAYAVTEISRQPIYRISSDRIKPDIKILGEMGGTTAPDSVVTVAPAIVRDVLNPSCYVTVTVTAPDGHTVTATDGTPLYLADASRAYTFTVGAVGKYTVTYASYDALSGRTSTSTSVVTVPDDTPPTVSFETAPQTSAKVGDAIIIPNIKATDDITEADALVIMRTIIAPNGQRYVMSGKSNALTAAMAGDYTIFVLVMDEAGNLTELRAVVTVE